MMDVKTVTPYHFNRFDRLDCEQSGLEVLRATWLGEDTRHDHGTRWAVLAVQKGVLLNTLHCITEFNPERQLFRLVECSRQVITQGEVCILLPGQIHAVKPITLPSVSLHLYTRLSDRESRGLRYIPCGEDWFWVEPY